MSGELDFGNEMIALRGKQVAPCRWILFRESSRINMEFAVGRDASQDKPAADMVGADIAQEPRVAGLSRQGRCDIRSGAARSGVTDDLPGVIEPADARRKPVRCRFAEPALNAMIGRACCHLGHGL